MAAIFTSTQISTCENKKVPWLGRERILYGFFSHSAEPPSQKFIYLFWHNDKSKAASASHNQIRAESESDGERMKLCNIIMLIVFSWQTYCEWCSAPPPPSFQFACVYAAFRVFIVLWMHLNVCRTAFNWILTDRLIYNLWIMALFWAWIRLWRDKKKRKEIGAGGTANR